MVKSYRLSVVAFAGLTLGLLALSPVARAGDYYVDAAAPAGGNGSSGAPYKTIQQGLNAAQPGDNVIVRAGTYTQASTLTFPRSGTDGASITLKAAPGEAVLVQTQVGLNISLIQTARSYITIEDITFDGNYNTANGMIRLDPGGAFQTFRRCEIRRQGNHLLRIDSSDLLVEDCNIHHAIWPASPSTDAHCTHSQTGFRHTFRRCDMHHATGDLWQGSRDGAWGDIVFENCDLHIELMDVTENGIAAGTPITENHLDTKNMAGIVNSNVTVRYCQVRGSRLGRLAGPGGTDAALNLKDGVQGFYIYGNIICNNQWALRLRYPSTGYHVYNNFIYDNDLAVRLEDGVADLAFLNNTFYKNTTLIQNVSSAAPLNWKNNVFATATGAVWPGTFTNNLFWSVPSGSWQSTNGNRVANPLFLDSAAYDLHLAGGSPAIDVGLTLTEITDDFDGDPRPVGPACDIGADEFRYAGDVDADGHVDVVDLLFFVDAFGSVLGDPAYDPRCDCNRDDSVDVVDLLMLVENFGN
jgi:hypothetical protein